MNSTEKWKKLLCDAGISSSDAATYACKFADNNLQTDTLTNLQEDYLKDMGITSMDDIRAILRHCKHVYEELQKNTENGLQDDSREIRADEETFPKTLQSEPDAEKDSKPVVETAPPMTSSMNRELEPSSVEVKPELSNAISSSSSRTRVVVFDIDGTLCKSNFSGCEDDVLRTIRKYYPEIPECSCVYWNKKFPSGGVIRYLHVFSHHLQILFDYLLQQDVRIVFFSSADEERNLSVIPELLTCFWGVQKFEALKAEGQFDIFSYEHTRAGIRNAERAEGNRVKDLKVVIRDNETLSDTILVDDCASYAAYDQKSLIFAPDLDAWQVIDKDRLKVDQSLQLSARLYSSPGKSYEFYLNNVYYMLGIFKTYFEHEKYEVLPLREALDQILPKEAYYKNPFFSSFTKPSFTNDMINLGLSQVQKVIPDAKLY